MDKLHIFDTTLRDGEQAPGAAMHLHEKLEVAQNLSELGVDVIEAGFPAASGQDFEAVRIIAEDISEQTICAFARSVERDIKIAGEALGSARKGRLEIVTPVSDVHLEKKLGISRERGLKLIEDGVKRAVDCTHEVAWIGEDSGRADPDFRKECFETAVKAGASTVVYADTVGYMAPMELHEDIKALANSVGAEAIVGVHCHDDLGLAVANTLAAVQGGAREVQCTINGIGERAGNAALEEVVMAITLRKELYQVDIGVNTPLLKGVSDLVCSHTGLSLARNKAVVGANAFAHASGMHQHGLSKHRSTYEIMDPTLVGWPSQRIIIGRHSGWHGLRLKLLDMGVHVTAEEGSAILEEIKNRPGDNHYIDDEELIEMIRRKYGSVKYIDDCS